MCEALSEALRWRRELGSLGLIAEIKRRRFGGVDLLRGRAPAEIGRAYREAGAAALSVVTSAVFGGSLRLLAEVSAADLGLPILRKDLIRDERDIAASKRAGASAVLLVVSLLGLERIPDLVQAARAQSIEPFVEVATRAEIDALRPLYDGLIATNNSDIRTNEVEGEGVSRSIGLIQRQDPRVWVSASRIAGPEDVAALAAAGFDGALVGTHLLLAEDAYQATCRMVAAARSEGTCA